MPTNCLPASSKLAIAMALSQDADLYVIDEPLANPDPESRHIAMNLMFERTKDKTLIVVMHGPEHYHGLFDRVVQIDLVSEAGRQYQESSLAV